MTVRCLLLAWLLLPISVVFSGITDIDVGMNLTNFLRHRSTRSLVFEGGGIIKLVVGPTILLQSGDPIAWRSLICTYNLHGGHYNIPSEPLYPWDKWEDTFARSMQRVQTYFDKVNHDYQPDDSRLFIYTALETLLNRKSGGSGRACLLRSICENAQVDHHVGMFSEILNLILTPGKEHLDSAYKSAKEAGTAGADCLKLYADCPAGTNLLDWYLDYM